MHKGQADLLNGKLLTEGQRLRGQEGKLLSVCLHKQRNLFRALADFCTAFMPDSDKIEPAERSSKGETFGAWKKSKTDIRASKNAAFRHAEFSSASQRKILKQVQNDNRRKAAFTLAEVLITLAIIGVVAAMTIPTLIQNYKKVETVSRLKKFYSIMNQAIKLSEIDNNDSTTWVKSETQVDEEGNIDGDAQNIVVKDFFMQYLAPYIKYLKFEDGQSIVDDNGNKSFKDPTVYFADGSTVKIWNGGCMDFNYDVNGDRKPNVKGRDIFVFIMCFTDEKRNIYTGNSKKIFYPLTQFHSYGSVTTPREQLLNDCREDASFCSILLMRDSWEIKDDYPYKL